MLLAQAENNVMLNYLYLLAAVLFYFGLKLLSSVKTARRGNAISALGMLLACVITLFYITGATAISLVWVVLAIAIGAGIGMTLAVRVPMTGMPQMVALFNGFGGIASLLVAWGEYLKTPLEAMISTDANAPATPAYVFVTVGLAVLIGGVTFTGSLVAFAKLQGGDLRKIIPDQPVQFPGQQGVILGSILACLLFSFALGAAPTSGWMVALIALVALTLGVLLVIGIGGADMPVVISLLNSYSGLAASMAGFVLGNQALIITGALVGASGIILTNIMCKAMNRSLMNVLFGGVGGAPKTGAGTDVTGTAHEQTTDDAAIVLDAAQLVVVVPGYGMAVAQAQHAVAELAELLQDRGVKVIFAIHPVAGRMPGHMNVLLAEANVSYDHLYDLDAANPEFEHADVALVIGANDVTNPAARTDTDSPIYGMPILDVDKARTVMVIKRSLSPGFAGVQNGLYFMDNCRMLFGDGKKVVNELIAEVKDL